MTEAANTARPDADRSHSRLDSRIFVLACAIFATFTDTWVLAGVLPLIAREFSVSVGTVGLLLTANMLINVMVAPLFAAVAAGWPRRRLIITCLSLFALAVAACALAPSFTLLVIGRLLAAACSAAYSPAAFSMATVIAPANRTGTALAILSFGLVSAQLLGVPLGAWVGNHLGWRMTFALNAALVMCMTLVLALLRIPSTTGDVPPSLRARFAPLTSPLLVMALLPSVFMWMGSNNVYFYTSVLFGGKFGANGVAALLVSYGLGGLVGSQLGGRVVDRFGPVGPTAVCLAINVINIGILGITGATMAGAVAAIFIMSMCGWAMFPMQQSRLLKLAPAHSTVVLALNSSAANLGTAIGAAVGAAIIDRSLVTTLPYAASLATALGLAAFVISLAIAKRTAAGAQPNDSNASGAAQSAKGAR